MTCPPPPDDFEAKTRAELTRLAGEATKAWPGHNCGEKAPCRHCAAWQRIHALINDHIDQLRGDNAQYTPEQIAALQVAAKEPVQFKQEPECSWCGRYRHCVQDQWLVCMDCDAPALPRMGLDR